MEIKLTKLIKKFLHQLLWRIFLQLEQAKIYVLCPD